MSDFGLQLCVCFFVVVVHFICIYVTLPKLLDRWCVALVHFRFDRLF